MEGFKEAVTGDARDVCGIRRRRKGGKKVLDRGMRILGN